MTTDTKERPRRIQGNAWIIHTIQYRFACINRQVHTMRFGAVRKAEIKAWVRSNLGE